MKRLAIPVAFFLALASPASIAAERIRIYDGDTLAICNALKKCERIRLAGIDVPERTQPYSQLSRRNLAELCQRAEITVESRKIDKYGRTIGRVTCNGIDASREQLKAGLAWHYKEYASEQPQAEREADAAAENAAMHTRAGLWAWPNQTPPWEFRHAKPSEWRGRL